MRMPGAGSKSSPGARTKPMRSYMALATRMRSVVCRLSASAPAARVRPMHSRINAAPTPRPRAVGATASSLTSGHGRSVGPPEPAG
jgi:hypothetical protein